MIQPIGIYRIMNFYRKSMEDLENVVERLEKLQDYEDCDDIPVAVFHAIGQIEMAINVLEESYRNLSVCVEGYDPESIKEEEDENKNEC